MRRYIRHPVDIPIEYQVAKEEHETGPRFSPTTHAGRSLHNLSSGGLCFTTVQRLQRGTRIQITIPCGSLPVSLKGEVRWCYRSHPHYEVGVAFNTPEEEFRLRMVEQLCYIAHYRREVARVEGRQLTRDEAAGEWIEKYAGSFPP